MESIERELILDVAQERVREALTDPEAIAGWFSDSAELEAVDGAEGWFTWTGHGRFAVRVEELTPRTRVVWRWARDAEAPLEQGPPTLMEWDLEQASDRSTLLRLRERGFVRDEDRRQNAQGWDQELRHLEAYLSAL